MDRKPNAFWLQLPSGRFYPDFMVLLTDGRIAAAEYKGAHLAEDARVKRQIGMQWAEASDGRCQFGMPTARDFSTLDASLRTPFRIATVAG